MCSIDKKIIAQYEKSSYVTFATNAFLKEHTSRYYLGIINELNNLPNAATFCQLYEDQNKNAYVQLFML